MTGALHAARPPRRRLLTEDERRLDLPVPRTRPNKTLRTKFIATQPSNMAKPNAGDFLLLGSADEVVKAPAKGAAKKAAAAAKVAAAPAPKSRVIYLGQ